MQAPRETIVLALLGQASQSIAWNFTANTESGSAVLTAVSGFGAMRAGWPLFAAGLPRNVAIQSLDTEAGTITLTQPATATASGVAVTSGFRTVGRRLVFPDDVAEQPALYVRYLKDRYPERDSSFLPKTVMEAELWVYCKAAGPDLAPDSALNPLIDAIELSLQPSRVTNVQTLGDLVVHCWIEGEIEKNPGDLDDTNFQAMAMIPIRILAP